MTEKEISRYTGDINLNIVEAMKKIDQNTEGILFILEDDRLIGTVTDGDIRRCLLNEGDLSIKVSQFMNRSPKYLIYNERNNAQQFMQRYFISAVPIVSNEHKIIDIIFEHVKVRKDKNRSSLKEYSVIIMAGGKGSRLYPYTKILPKPLIPIGDIPIVERIIERFAGYEVEDFLITVNYKKGMIKSYLDELEHSYQITYVEENKPLGTAGSIRLIERKFDKPVIITNCDILINTEYDKLMEYHLTSGNAVTIVSALKNITVPYGVIHSAGQGIVTQMEEKPQLSYFVNTGMYILNPEYIDYIPVDAFFHMTDLIDVLLKNNKQVGTYPISEDSFLDMGEFEEMERMEAKLNIKSE